MPADKPIPLVGRLAIQLKMLTPEEVKRAIGESAASGNPRLAQVFLQMGLLDREQIAKLQTSVAAEGRSGRPTDTALEPFLQHCQQV